MVEGPVTSEAPHVRKGIRWGSGRISTVKELHKSVEGGAGSMCAVVGVCVKDRLN